MRNFHIFIICLFLLFCPSLTGVFLSAQNSGEISFVKKTDENIKNHRNTSIIEKPLFRAGDETYLRLNIPRLKTRWGQGYIRWNYTYYTRKGIKIWSSKVMTIRKESLLTSWTLQEDIPITINQNIEVGIYFIEINIKDYYSKKKFSYRIRFEVESTESKKDEKKDS